MHALKEHSVSERERERKEGRAWCLAHADKACKCSEGSEVKRSEGKTVTAKKRRK